MKRAEALRNFIVGAVFLGSLVLVGIVTLSVTGLNLTSESNVIAIAFDTVSGLRVGDEVRIYGYRIGQVDRIEPIFQPRPATGGVADPKVRVRPIRAFLKVNGEPELTTDTQFLVRSAGPLGGNFVEIIPGRGDRKTITADDWTGVATPDVFEEFGDLVRENRSSLSEAIKEIRDAVKAINEREGTIGALIKDPQMRDRVSRAVENVERITTDIAEGKGTLGKLVGETKLHDQVESFFTRMSKFADDIEAGRGALGMLIKDPTFAQDLKVGVSDLRALIAGVARGEGTFGVLLKDEATAKGFKQGVQDAKDIVAKINQGEGTIGQLVNNREAWDRAVFVLRQVQEAVEDFREQAPINSFINVLFAPL